MLEIPLRNAQGQVVAVGLIDDQDAGLLRWRWYRDSAGYVRRDEYLPETQRSRCIRIHRQIMGLSPGDGREVDHLNGDKLDNRRKNLVITTRQGNSQNLRSRRLLPRGVYVAANGRFYAQVKHQGKKYCLGHHDTPGEAGVAAATKRRELQFHGGE